MMFKNLILTLFFCLFFNNVFGIKFQISYISNSYTGDNTFFQLNLNDTSITGATILLNDVDVTSFCRVVSTPAFYHCEYLPVANYIKSGNFLVSYDGWTTNSPYYFGPSIHKVTYPSGSRLSTAGGIVTLTGLFFDTLTFQGLSNGLQAKYRGENFSDYTIINSTTVVANIPAGSGGLGTNRADNQFLIHCYNNNSVTPGMISYNHPTLVENLEYNSGRMLISGNDLGFQPELIRVYACGRTITDIKIINNHTLISALYDDVLFLNRSCNNIRLGVNDLNSTSPDSTLTLPPTILSVSTPPIQGGMVEIIGKYIGNLLVGGYDGNWRLIIDGTDYSSQSCSTLTSWRLVCSSPVGVNFNTNLSFQIKVYPDTFSPVFNAVYSETTISGSTKVNYTKGGIVTIYGSNFFENSLRITIGGSICTTPTYININTISCLFDGSVLPNKKGLSITVTSINGYVEIKEVFQYLPAPFTNVIQSGGDNIQLIGDYFSTGMTVYIGSNDITSYCKTDNYTSISCTHIPNVKSTDIIITGGDSSTFSSFFFSPFILQMNNDQIPTIGSKITLIGKYFEQTVLGGSTQTLSIIVDGASLPTSEFKLISLGSIEINMPPGVEDGVPHRISVQSVDKISEPIYYYYMDYVKIKSIIQINQGLKINGFGFRISTNNLIEFGTIDITPSCIIVNDSEITCETLPLGSISGYFKISGDGGASNFKVLLNPIILSISKTIIDSKGETVDIIGRFFESIDPTTGNNNSIYVYIDGNASPMLNTIAQNDNLISTTIIGGLGSTHSMIVNTENRLSNSINYSYSIPIINFFSQNGKQFTINANHFSKDDLSLNKIFVNNIPVVDGGITLSKTNDNELIFSLESNTQNGEIILQVVDQKSIPIDIFLSPIIESLSPKPYIDGSIGVMVNGFYFHNKNFKTLNTLDLTCNYNSTSENNNKSIKCEYFDNLSVKCFGLKGYDNGSLVLSKIDGTSNLISNSFNFEFQNPKVIKSTSLFYKNAGNIIITAESFSSENLKIFVESVECLNPVVLDNRHIQCYYDASTPPKEDGKSLNITIDSYSMIGSNQVFYYYDSFKCENNCTAPNGVCNEKNGYCECTKEWEGIDCSIEKQKVLPPKPEINEGNGGSNIPGASNLNFTVSIAYLREIDFNGNPIKVLDMSTIDWVNKSKSGDQDQYYFKGTFTNDNTTVELDITYYKDALSDYDFAGDIISIPENSIKYIITVSNWEFKSSLSSFQLVYNAETLKTVENECSTSETTSTQSNIKDQSASWFQISSGISTLNGKFARRIFVDETVRKSTITILPMDDSLYKLVNESKSSNSFNKLTAINAPYFTTNVILDPSFSSLLTTDNSDECSSNTWKTPTIAVLCSVGGVGIATATTFAIYKKKKDNAFKKRIVNLTSNK